MIKKYKPYDAYVAARALNIMKIPMDNVCRDGDIQLLLDSVYAKTHAWDTEWHDVFRYAKSDAEYFMIIELMDDLRDWGREEVFEHQEPGYLARWIHFPNEDFARRNK